MQNIHEHQYQFMKEFEQQQGISFLVIFFTTRNELYYMPFRELQTYVERIEQGHPKYFEYQELNPENFIRAKGSVLVHYLEPLSRDLMQREE